MSKFEIPNLDDYKIIRILNEGGEGKVYLVENKTTHEQFAAKVIKEQLSEEDEEEERAKNLNEVIMLSRMNNPAIIKLFRYCLTNFEKDPNLTIIIEYMPNGSLQQMLTKLRKNNAPKEWTNTVAYINLLGIAIGMKYLHSQNIVQRDLKPLNTLLDENYYPRITDFGLSKQLHDENFRDELMKSQVGTLVYQAPEIIQGELYNCSVDVYAYSILAYEIITKRNPIFKNMKNVAQFIQKVLTGARPDTKDIDPDIVKLLEISWSTNPSERPLFTDIVEILEENWFYSKFGVDEIEIKKYLERFEGENLKENITSPNLSNIYKKLFEPKLNSSSQSISFSTSFATIGSLSTIDLDTNQEKLDESSLQSIENLINDVFDSKSFLKEDLQNCQPEDLLITPENIQKPIQKKPYEDFVPTVLLHLDRSLENIDYECLQQSLGSNAVILNVQSYNTNLQNGFLFIEDFEPYAKKIPTILQIALLSIEHFDSNINNKLKGSLSELVKKLEKNQSYVGKICKKSEIHIPNSEHIKSVFKRPSINCSINIDKYGPIEINLIRQLVLQKLQNDKDMYNWKFFFEHEDLYKQMNEKIREDLEMNPFEMVMLNQIIFPNNLLNEYEKIKNQDHKGCNVECFLYSGSILKKDEQGFYATTNPFYAAKDSNDSKILEVNEKTEIFCCAAIFNALKVKDLTNSLYNGNPSDDDVKNNYGAKYMLISIPGKNIITAHQYIFSNNIQLIPLCSFTIMRKDHYVIWRDTNLFSPQSFDKSEVNYMKEASRKSEINVYIKFDSDDALNVIRNKIYSHAKLITNGGYNANGKDLIENARKNIGANVVCLVFANDDGHLDWISKMENVFFTKNEELFSQFVMLNMNLNDVIDFDKILRKQDLFEKNNKKPWVTNQSEILNFPESKQTPPLLPPPHTQCQPSHSSSLPCNLA